MDMDILSNLLPSRQPDSQMQALMEAVPHNEPAQSREIVDEIEEVVLDIFEKLSEQDKFIIEAIGYERITFVELGKRMGISNVHAWRLKNIAYENFKQLLLGVDCIKEQYGD